MMYGFWVMKHDRQNQNFEKVKKHWRNYHLSPPPQQFRKSKLWKNEKITYRYCHLHMCIINDNHMMYGSWDMEHGQQTCLSFWTIFCLFTPPPQPSPPPLATQKIKILKNEKNAWRYHNFTKLYQKSWSYATLLLRYNVWLLFFALFPLNNPKNKFKKKKCLEISKYTCVTKVMTTWCTVPEIWCAMDGRTDRWMDGKSDILYFL